MSLRNSVSLLKGNNGIAINVSLYNKMSTISPSAKVARLEKSAFKPEAVIFDKDGTLVCFHTMWTPWCTSLASRMTSVSGIDLSNNVYEVLGYDHLNSKVKIGALAENTHPEIKDKITDMLRNHPKVSCEKKARKYVESAWRDTPENMRIKATGNLNYLFARLQHHDVRVAICTSDSREGTEEFLERQGLTDLVDIVVCGDDSFGKPKPNPHNANYICNKLGVNPANVIMVGDTPADTLMGQSANLGLTVGVLSGVGNHRDLADADVICEDVKECVDMLIPSDNNHGSKIHQVTTRGLFKIAQGSFLWHQMSSKRSMSTYSHLIVGAGSAGCVLANRLTEERQ